MNDIAEIKSRLDIVDIVSDYVELRRSGHNYSGFCPFHPNSRTPAFYVFPETQTWRCFGACAEGGDIFSFVMKKEGWDFKEALKEMAQRAGVELTPLKPVDKVKEAANEAKFTLLDAAADYFHQLLLYAPEGQAARTYLERRGLNEDTIAAFRLGFSLPAWSACQAHFGGQGYSNEDLLAVGLLTENQEKGTVYDRFRNRFMIPIRNIDGRVVGFGARTMEKDGIPKYLNSPQTAVFDKSGVLYGLSSAKRHIREARQVVIVEGYMDVLQAWQAGFRNMVAQMGTALTAPQLNLLKRYTKRYVLALDADAAGQKATMRGLQVARETLDRESISSFDARGLVQHEGRLKADIRVVMIPEGKDPDNIIADDPAAWTALLATARPVVQYVIDMATADLDENDAKAKTAVAQQVIPLIKDIGEPVERNHYWQLLADKLKVDERALRRVELPQKKRPFQQRKPSPPPAEHDSAGQRPIGQRGVVQAKQPKKSAKKAKPSPMNGNPPPPDAPPDWYMQDTPATDGSVPPPPDGDWLEGSGETRQPQTAVLGSGSLLPAIREENYLRECFRHLVIMQQVNQKLKLVDQTAVNTNDFALAEDKEIFNHLQQYTVATTEQLCDSLSEPLRNRALTLLRLPDKRDVDLNRLAETLTLSVCDWRLAKVKQHIREIRFIHSNTSQETDSKNNLHLYQDELNRLTAAMLNLHQAKNRMSASSRRQAE